MPPQDEPLDPAQGYDYVLFWLVIVAVSAVLVLRDTGTVRHKVLWITVLALLPCIGLFPYYLFGGKTLNWGNMPGRKK